MNEIAIFGATGYGGQELLRLLATHPWLRVTAAVSDRARGKRIEEVRLKGSTSFYDCKTWRGGPDNLIPNNAVVLLALSVVEKRP